MATNAVLRGATPGLGRLAMAIGGQGYEQGYDAELQSRSRLAQAMAAARAHDAAADQNNTETSILRSRPGMIDESVALSTGSTLPQIQAVREFTRTGQMPMKPSMGPPTEDGTSAMQFPVVDDATRSTIGQALARMLPMYTNLKDVKPDDLAKATQLYRENDLGDQVLRGQLTPGQVGASQAAVGGKALYNSDATGAVLDLFGGKLDTANPMAKSTMGLRDAQAGQAKAGAAENYAQAGKANAEAANARQEGGGAGKAPVGYRWNAGALEPIPGGPADPATKGAKLAKPPTEGQAKALMFGSRMAVADEILSELSKAGHDMPNLTKRAAESLPFIGEGVGMLANSMATDEEQQIEQAQRDFINAVLRRESGAAIADSEFANARKQYFPEPNDSDAKKRQKAANRQTAIAGFKAEFGEQSMPQFTEIVGQARKTRSAPEGGWDKAAKPAAPAVDPKGRPALDSFRK